MSSPNYVGDGFSSSSTSIGGVPPSFLSTVVPSQNRPGDGFTAEELERAKDPLNCVFNPTREYAKCDIGSLEKGPNAVSFCGRVVNLSVSHGKSQTQSAAKGWINLVVSDGSGAIMVSNYFECGKYSRKSLLV